MQGRLTKKLTRWHGGKQGNIAHKPSNKESCVEKIVKVLTTSLLCVTIGVATGIVIQRGYICFSK